MVSSVEASGALEARLPTGLSQVRLHHHLCQIESSRRVELTTAARYLSHGLERGEVCLYVSGDADDLGEVRAALAAAGVGPDREQGGQLRLVGPRAFQLRLRPFDPDEMLDFVRAQVDEVRAAGFPGLRVAVDMTWTLLDHPGSDRFLEFESRVDEIFHDQPITALCQYRTGRLGAGVLRGALHTHRLVVARGAVRENGHFLPPEEFLRSEDPAAQVERMIDGMRAFQPGGMVAVCAWCKSVHDGASWSPVADFLARRAGVEVTHGMCPRCDRHLAGA